MTEDKKNPLLSGIMAGYLIILAHLLLIIILATAVIFIQTLAEYIEYVLAGGLLIIFGSAVFFYRILKQNGKQIIDTLKNPAFQGQNIEISLLGGLASVSINNPERNQHLMLDHQTPTIQALPDLPASSPQNELSRMADLHDRGLISKEEFLKLKNEILTDQM
ncbi:MAG: SHOCT domain-containing protein [Pseudomonadota bacterium]|nr:SHOCT domain-containing protein [Pseudomonadota bacterium]